MQSKRNTKIMARRVGILAATGQVWTGFGTQVAEKKIAVHEGESTITSGFFRPSKLSSEHLRDCLKQLAGDSTQWHKTTEALRRLLIVNYRAIQKKYEEFLETNWRGRKRRPDAPQTDFAPLAIDVCHPKEAQAEHEKKHMKRGEKSKLCDEVIVLGDVHGAFVDLVRMLAKLLPTNDPKSTFWGEDPVGTIILLGDWMDRAPVAGDSFFTILFVMWLQAAFPDRVVLLRGNHETDIIFSNSCKNPGSELDALHSNYKSIVIDKQSFQDNFCDEFLVKKMFPSLFV
ncbi:unnamed protein product [Amoebophrya sp. A120]|nr:unnamed protein product [Amoebophrya sp. A120]|eukprot:GSA120T00013365001.1